MFIIFPSNPIYKGHPRFVDKNSRTLKIFFSKSSKNCIVFQTDILAPVRVSPTTFNHFFYRKEDKIVWSGKVQNWGQYVVTHSKNAEVT